MKKRVAGFELHRFLQVKNRLLIRGGGNFTVDHLGQRLEQQVEAGDLVVPTPEDMPGQGITRIEFRCGDRLGLDHARKLELAPGVTEKGQAAGGDGDGQPDLRVLRGEFLGLECISVALLGQTQFLGARRGVDHHLDVLLADLAQQFRILRLHVLGLEIKLQRLGGFEFPVEAVALLDPLARSPNAGREQKAEENDTDWIHFLKR